MKVSIPIILVALLLVCCQSVIQNSDDTIYVTDGDFSKIIHLEPEHFKIPTPLFRTKGLVIVDSFLVIMQPLKREIFDIYLLPDVNYYGSFGKLGKGPNEFFDFRKNTFAPFHSAESGFAISNRGSRLEFFNIQDIYEQTLLSS